MLLIVIIIGTFYFFQSLPLSGVTYSRFHFTIFGLFFPNLWLFRLFDVANYQFNIEIYQHNPLNFKYLSAWSLFMSFYLPWVFIGNLGLKSLYEWAQKKFEQDMDELESGE